jgi:hypothetical protein
LRLLRYLTASNGPCDKCDQSVLTIVSQVIESVEKVIPSFVRIEASKERLDFQEQIFAASPQTVIEVGSGFPKWEGGNN